MAQPCPLLRLRRPPDPAHPRRSCPETESGQAGRADGEGDSLRGGPSRRCRGALDLLALDDALSSLETFDPRKATVVELRFFAGLTIEETAEQLGISTETVSREWRRAKAWLYRRKLPAPGKHKGGIRSARLICSAR